MDKGKMTSYPCITFDERIACCRNYVRDERRPLDEVLDEFLNFWREVSVVVSEYEAAHRLLSQLPSDLKDWAGSLLGTLVRANPFTLDPHVDLEFFVASVKAKVRAMEREVILNERKANETETKADSRIRTKVGPRTQATKPQQPPTASRKPSAQQQHDERKALDMMLKRVLSSSGTLQQ